ncbi:MAG: EcsC family protein [Limisphaerales bacterium]
MSAAPPVLPPVSGVSPRDWPAPDRAALARARELLGRTSLAVRFANLVGAPLERGFQLLPANWRATVQHATDTALKAALRVAVGSLPSRAGGRPSNRLHRLLAGTSGALGGAFGFSALPAELPVSTTLMLRSIASIAASEGHDLRDPETRLECLQVFALGGVTETEARSEQSYWLVRAGLAQALRNATAALAAGSLSLELTPPVVQWMARIAARFGVVVSQQAAAKAVPVLGAVAGAAVNVAFTEHFQRLAEAHFILRRLEKVHGAGTVHAAFHAAR